MSAFLPAILAFGAFVGAVVLVPRILDVRSPASFVCALGIAAYALLLAVSAAAGVAVSFWPVSALYWFLFLAFLVLFLVVYRSVSLRILGDLLDRPGHAEPYERLFENYLRSETLNARLGFLVETGNVREGAAGLALTDKGRRNGRIVAAVQRLFKIEFGG